MAIGFEALKLNVGSFDNIAIGKSVMSKLDGSGSNQNQRNVAIGNTAMMNATTTHDYNVAIGYGALMGDASSMTDADNNVAIGYQSISKITPGDRKIGLGTL